ncbi:MAG: metallophosphatase family protein [Anaerolineae bacterium]|nr:metallophosphatase family protein [Anaerolineae bacterium]
MNIGLISDVHADLPALKLALDMLQRQGVDQIICAGDLVDKGLDGDAVVSLLRERQIPCVLGNHDEKAENTNYWIKQQYGSSHARILTDDTIAFLSKLPLTQRFEWAGINVMLAHGRPWSNDEYLYAHSDKDTLRTVVRYAKAEIVILGHTHEPMQVKVGTAWVLNPGSVCSYDAGGSHTFATLSLPNCTFRVFDLKTGERVQPEYAEIA